VKTPAKHTTLLRVLGVTFGVAVSVGGTVGVAILRAPGPVAAQFESPSAALLLGLWLAGGLFVFISACSIAELATMLPQAGGFYVYTRAAFGDAVGFTAGWVDWLTQCSALAYLGVSMAEFAAALLPALAPWATVICVFLILGLTFIQWRGTRVSGRTQEIASAIQAIGFTLFLAACFALAPENPATALVGPPSGSLWLSAALALRLIVATFDGWYSAIYFTEEVRDPARSLPRSMLGGAMLIAAIYVLSNAALLRVLPVSALPGMNLPAADAAASLFGEDGRRLATLLCLLSLPPAFNSALLVATRISCAMSRDGPFWVDASGVNPRGTPGLAMFVSALAGIALSVSGSFVQLLARVGVLNAATYCASLASLLVLRRRDPAAPRPFSARPYPWLTLSALSGGVLLLIGAIQGDPRGTVQALALIAAGYPLYRLSRRVRVS
jgi:APA family basic amino acid/polyamine antiporter